MVIIKLKNNNQFCTVFTNYEYSIGYRDRVKLSMNLNQASAQHLYNNIHNEGIACITICDLLLTHGTMRFFNKPIVSFVFKNSLPFSNLLSEIKIDFFCAE